MTRRRELIESLLGRTDLSDDLRHSFRRWLIHFYGARSATGFG